MRKLNVTDEQTDRQIDRRTGGRTDEQMGGGGGALQYLPPTALAGDKTTFRVIQPNPSYDMLLMSSQRTFMQKERKSY